MNHHCVGLQPWHLAGRGLFVRKRNSELEQRFGFATVLGKGMPDLDNPDRVKYARGITPMVCRTAEIAAAELRKEGEAH